MRVQHSLNTPALQRKFQTLPEFKMEQIFADRRFRVVQFSWKTMERGEHAAWSIF